MARPVCSSVRSSVAPAPLPSNPPRRVYLVSGAESTAEAQRTQRKDGISLPRPLCLQQAQSLSNRLYLTPASLRSACPLSMHGEGGEHVSAERG